ncbi:ANTAR domain-containing protein [Mycolicibacterium sp.]|uniref:ANTAR domain-containing protein n=1 Tax=Mycolicibacterium sp. TaxID=2320850 RepID=UPI0025F18940|nr:ANTAR domain-containing protein [Mycolicibacterium sp.]
MPAPVFHPRGHTAESELFARILDRIDNDLPDCVGLAVSVHGKNDEHSILAAKGVGGEFVEVQLAGSGGPVADAVEHQVPVLSPQLWEDDRWPALTRQSGADWPEIRGVVSVPGIWQADTTVVVSVMLRTPATAADVITLIGYEQLITAAMVTSEAQDGSRVADMMAVLQSRGIIEQAKGAIMGLLRCDADTAWATLRRASHESNVKLRVLAVAFVEYMSGAPAEQPTVGAPIVPDEDARRAAQMLWAVLSHASKVRS